MRKVFLGLGTNLGNREANLDQAIDRLQEAVRVVKVSPIYQTAAWGLEDQPDFLNVCLEGKTNLEPWDLLHFLKDLEVDLGREETIRWGPRLIDIDILLMGEVVMSEPGLTIPHKGLPDRAFVLVPLADIAPDVVHPQTGETIAEMLAEIDTSSVWPYKG